MKEIISTVTSKGQVTVPAEVRRLLGINKQEKIAFVIDQEGEVHLKAPRYPSIAALRGAAGTLRRPVSESEIEEIVEDERAQDLLSKFARSRQ